MSAVNITFPGTLAQVDTAADLRLIPSSFLPNGSLYAVPELSAVYTYDPGSSEVDDGTDILRPADRTAGQAGRWVRSPNGLAFGRAGPSNNTRLTVAGLKEAAVTDKTSLYDGSLWTWTTGDFTGKADDLNVVKADSTALTVGAWVRQKAEGVSFAGASAGEVVVPVSTLLQTAIDVRRFGAKCDGVADDTVAAQKCIAACLASSPAADMLVTGQCKLSASLMIDRPVDVTESEFRIVGVGKGAGFVTDAAITMFSSTITLTNDPVSEFVRFENIRFKGGAAVAYSHSHHFLRITFQGCTWYSINCVNASIYAQEWKFLECQSKNATADFFAATGAFAVHSTHGKYRGGVGDVFNLTKGSVERGINSCTFVGDTIESNGGSAICGGLAQGLFITIYTENNTGTDVDLSLGGTNIGVTIVGSSFTPSSGNWAIDWGVCAGGFSAGNKANGVTLGRLHNNDLAFDGGLVSIGDVADLARQKKADQFILGQPTGMFRPDKNIVAHPGGGAGSAVQLNAPYVYVSVCASAGDSVKLPEALVDPAAGKSVYIVNNGAQACTVYGKGSDIINGGASANVASGGARMFVCYNNGQWVSAGSPVTVAGSRGGNAALANLLASLASAGFVIDETTA